MTVQRQTHCTRGHELTDDNLYKRSCRICSLERNAKRYAALDPTAKEKMLYKQAIRQTGRTKDEYERAYLSQNGLCAICGQPDLTGRLCSDHDHRCCNRARGCGKCVRGFLCRKCNQGIGLLLDSPELLRTAAAYLETWRRVHDERTTSAVGVQTPPRPELSSSRFDG